MRCDKCRRPAVLFQRYSGLHLCRDHFIADFEARAKRTIRKNRWIAPGDRIAVAFSGGKDSGALLSFLHKVFSPRRDVSLLAITVDEGIGGYRDPAVSRARARELGIPHVTVSFREEYGVTVDEIVARKGGAHSCTYCGVLRRHLLNTAAREAGATKLAMGFNLDDEAQTVLMNVLRGDSARLLRPSRAVPGLVPRIRPFLSIPEREVALYAYLTTGTLDVGRCPYSVHALRAEVRQMLNAYAWRHPSARFALVNLGNDLSAAGRDLPGGMRVCPDCGEVCAAACRSCEILAEVRGGR
ncbi:MAG: ATP-binding protein [Methanolinea sp.]|nr:ATP-binding protein [Methanolinea sp.]